jgi:hypothetical protein
MSVPVLEVGSLPLHDPVAAQPVAPVVVQLAVAESPCFKEVGLMTSSAVGFCAVLTMLIAEAALGGPLASHPNSDAVSVNTMSECAKYLRAGDMSFSRLVLMAIRC